MNPVNTALWYVESHFASDLTLDEIARHAGVSTFYLTRAFAISSAPRPNRSARAAASTSSTSWSPSPWTKHYSTTSSRRASSRSRRS
jgi:hypothetical protein